MQVVIERNMMPRCVLLYFLLLNSGISWTERVVCKSFESPQQADSGQKCTGQVNFVPGPQGVKGGIGPRGLPGAKGAEANQTIVEDLMNRVTQLEQQLAQQQLLLNTTATTAYLGYKVHSSGWITPFNGYQYKVTSTMQSWQDSRTLCQNMGGDLAVHGMQDFGIRQTIVRAVGIQNMFIGMSDIATEGTWLWITGQAAYSDTAHWGKGRPYSGVQDYDCGRLYDAFGYDTVCTATFPGLCEKAYLL